MDALKMGSAFPDGADSAMRDRHVRIESPTAFDDQREASGDRPQWSPRSTLAFASLMSLASWGLIAWGVSSLR